MPLVWRLYYRIKIWGKLVGLTAVPATIPSYVVK